MVLKLRQSHLIFNKAHFTINPSQSMSPRVHSNSYSHSEQKLPNVGYLPNAQFATVFEDTHANWVELPKFFGYLRYPDLSRTKYPGFLGISKYPYLLRISDTHKFLEVEDTHVLRISRYPIFATLYIIKH